MNNYNFNNQFDDSFDLSSDQILNLGDYNLNDLSKIKRIGKIYKGETIRGLTYVLPFVEVPLRNRTVAQIKHYYYPDSKLFTETNISLITDVDTDNEINKFIKELYLDVNKNKINDEGDVPFKLIVFVSKDGNKIKETYEVTEPEEDMIIFFIEDQTGDLFSEQVIYGKIAPKLQEQILKLKKRTDVNFSKSNEFINSFFSDSNDLMNELISTGSIVKKRSIPHLILKGFLDFMRGFYLVNYSIGYVVSLIGKGVLKLKVPDKYWDTQDEDYIFKEKFSKDVLTVDQSSIQDFKNVINDVDEKETIKTLGTTNINKLRAVVDAIHKKVLEYNQYMEDDTKKYNSLYGEPMNVNYQDFQNKIAFQIGVYNGFIDFIGSTISFIGDIFKSSKYIQENYDEITETLDNILDFLRESDWSKIFESYKETYDRIKNYLRNEAKNDDYDWIRISYLSGFGMAFFATLFIPILNISQIVNASSKLGKLGSSLIEALNTIKKSTSVATKAGKEGFRQTLSLIDNYLALLKRGGKQLVDFFESVWKKIAEWFLKNKKTFGKFANRTGVYAEKYVGRKLQPLVNSSTAFFKYGDAGRKVVKAVDDDVAKLISNLSKKKRDELVMVSGMIFKQGGKTSKAFTRTNFTKIEIGNLAKNGKFLDDFGKPSVYQKFLDDMHPILKKRFEKHLQEISKGLNASADDIARAGKPGSHGEIRALDDLLKSIDPNGIKYGDEVFKYIYGYNRFLPKVGVQPPCAHCHFITYFVNYIGL